MKLGLGSYAYRWSIGIGDRRPADPMPPEALLDQAAALGLGLVQYADNLPLDRLDDARLDALKAHADALGLGLELGTQSFDPGEVDRYLEIGARIGAPLLRVALDEADARIPVADLADQLRPRVARARDAGLRIAMENHFNYPSPSMVELLERVDDDHLGVCLDVANSICAGEWPEETVTLLAPWTINLHLKDYMIRPDRHGVGFRIEGVPLGEGRAPLDWILDRLAHCPAEMSVILEHWLPWEKGETETEIRAREQNWMERTSQAAQRLVAKRASRQEETA
ncbi:sugar phosphate isomerase/epimerase family protein [Limimaricola cinnabarinus]|uniref:Xylose isomerase-like TIM barrel domain-containing protein n=1 Tax=Limimaricola cinnabarinus LL-001 TaxID=1337093 RepID=U2YPQ8_9RHOB|nr:sugar phosphate isomerase/epimerase family protein [Limimaricola cinnabarinus]GAD57366.1 hypothetical protein MBELCI_3418 [Limimaricola cinnabarinus LL-001]